MRKITFIYEGEEERETEKDLSGAIMSIMAKKNVVLRSYDSSYINKAISCTASQQIEVPDFLKNQKPKIRL